MEHLNLPARIFMYSICTAIEYDIKIHILKYIPEKIEYTKEMENKFVARLKNTEESTNEDKINCLDLSDYIEIISKEPVNYKINTINLNKLKEYFLKIIPIRNRVMHTKPLEIGDRAILQEVIENIGKDISFIEWNETQIVQTLLKESPEKLVSKYKPIKFQNNYYHNLPVPEFDDTGYIGRKKEQSEIRSLILEDKYPVISIIGNGGIGKTAIVVKILYDLIDDSKNPYEAIIWISLKARTLSNGEFVEIKNAIANTEQVIKNLEKQVIFDEKLTPKENVLKFMNNFKTLLVIDNLETINDESINGFIKEVPKESKVLITSRTGLGELEYRYQIFGMKQDDAIQYYRELSKYYGLNTYKKTENEIKKLIEDILYSNPLSIKWYITGIYNGLREDEIKNNKNNLIEFCMSNVYEKLTEISKEILRLFQIENYEMSYGEIAYYIDKDEDSMKKAMNELMATNMVTLKDSMYQINMMAKDYLQLIQKIDTNFMIEITNKKRKLNGLLQNITVKKENLKLNPSTILYDFEDKDKKIAAIYLNKALEEGRNKNLPNALKLIEKAENIAPNYFECYKIKAFLHANFKNMSDAIKNYQIAIEKCQTNEEYAEVYYVYSSFYTVAINDNQSAYDLIIKAESYDSNDLEIKLQKARILSRLGRFVESEEIINNIKDEEITSDKLKNIKAKTSADLYRLWSEIFEPRDEKQKLEKISKGITSIIKLEHPDKKAYVTLLSLLKELSYMFYNEDAMKLLLKVLSKNYSQLKSLTGNDMKYIERNIFSHENEIDNNIYNELKKYIIDYKKISNNILDKNKGIITYISDRYGFISNASNKSIYFTKNNLKTKINVGEIVTFDTYTNSRGIGAINIEKIEEKINNYYECE